MKYLAAAAFACAMFAIPGTAMAASDTKVFASVTKDDLVEIVKAEGHTVTEMDPYEAPSLVAKTADGLVFVLIGTACTDEATKQCSGIMMQVHYDSDDTVTLENLNKSNNAQAAVQSYWNTDESLVGFNRYVILDGGVTWLNIRQNLRVLLEIAPIASENVFP